MTELGQIVIASVEFMQDYVESQINPNPKAIEALNVLLEWVYLHPEQVIEDYEERS